MDVRQARLAFRDRSLLDVIDLSVRFLAANAAIYLRLCAVVLIPALLLSWQAMTHLGAGWGWLLVVIASMFLHTPFTILGSRLVFQDEVRVRDVLSASLRALPAVFGVRFVQLLAVGLGSLVLMIPGAWAAGAFLYVVEVLVLERSGVSASLRRANRLTHARFGDVLSTLLLLLALHFGVLLVGDIALRRTLSDLLQIQPPPPVWDAAASPLALIAFWSFVPFYATARFLCYLNLRARIEGWDIQTRFAGIVARAEQVRT